MPTLEWIGKKAVINHHNEIPFRTLQCHPDLSIGEEDSGNFIVQGDNLDALKALLPLYAGQVKLIYIDPPYNTGEENWVYDDNTNSPETRLWLEKTVGKEFVDLSRHDKWLCMMYPRLQLLKQFLSDDGTFWISLDDNAFHFGRILLDELFGTHNFLSNIVWQKRISPDARRNLGAAHDYVLVFAKNLEQAKKNLRKIPLSGTRIKDFKNPDNDPKGLWASVDMSGQSGHATPNQFYQVTTPSGKTYRPSSGRCWAYAEATYKKMLEDGKIWFGKNGDGKPRVKNYLSETEGSMVWSWWTNVEVGSTQDATKEVNSLLGGGIFETPKPTRLIRRILEIATDKDSLVLDSFAGSGTTAHAVLAQNAADGGERRFILIEMEQYASSLTAERVRRVIGGYQSSKSETEQVAGLGGGFRYCTLGETLFDEYGQLQADASFTVLARHVFFTETRQPLPANWQANGSRLGVVDSTEVHLLLEDLDLGWLEALPEFAGLRVVYANRCLLSSVTLEAAGLVFRQIPYQVRVA